MVLRDKKGIISYHIISYHIISYYIFGCTYFTLRTHTIYLQQHLTQPKNQPQLSHPKASQFTLTVLADLNTQFPELRPLLHDIEQPVDGIEVEARCYL
jgi:hypothetical protein